VLALTLTLADTRTASTFRSVHINDHALRLLAGGNGPVIVCPDYAAIHDIERATWDYEDRLTPIA
jgi:hypothetical protein